jgi:hypothetical protein
MITLEVRHTITPPIVTIVVATTLAASTTTVIGVTVVVEVVEVVAVVAIIAATVLSMMIRALLMRTYLAQPISLCLSQLPLSLLLPSCLQLTNTST